jgi:Na+/H+-dicarboxylate symporter
MPTMNEEIRLPWFRQLHWQIFIAMALGICAGLIGGEALANQVGWLGTLFIRLLKMVIVPLVITSVVSGVASVGGGRSLGRMFSKTLGYYVLSSALAILVGLIIVNILKPGVGAQFADVAEATLPSLDIASSPVQILLNMVPENIAAAAATGDMLALIVFAILLGAAIANLPKGPQDTLRGFFEAAFEAIMKLTGWIIRLAPIGVFGLIVRVVGVSGFGSFKALGLYMVTIVSSLTIHLFITLPLLLLLLGRIKPQIHFRNMLEPLTLAFSTSSSAATLPVTMKAVEQKVGVSNRVSSFVLPMGATVNMDGTAIYECAGALFIAQALGVDLSLTQQLIVMLTALLASIGAAAVPSAGLVVIFIVLEAVNLRGPEVDVIVGAMLAVDRPLDMYRTAVNVFSDSCGAAIIARSEGETEVDTRVVA